MPSLLSRPLPEPPPALRRGPLRAGTFRSHLHDALTAVLVGRWLGAAFATCFVTGLISHYLQQPPSWLTVPSRPVWGYRVSQGIHVSTGIACIPLLLAKLWTVSPRFWAWPPVRSVLHGLERLSILVLVSSAIFEVVTGLVNTVQWYPWKFYFPRAHYYVAWVAIGSILLHLAVKLPRISAALASRRATAVSPGTDAEAGLDGTQAGLDGTAAGADDDLPLNGDRQAGSNGLSRRGLLVAVAAAVGTVTAVTVGQTVGPLRRLDLLAPRRPDLGPQGLPVNRTAEGAGIRAAATDPGYRLTVGGPTPYTLSLAELRALPQYEAELPITCVEGWSASARWRGVRVRDLLSRAGAPAGGSARVTSLERGGLYRESILDSAHAADELTLLAFELNGEPLALDHGYPLRLIAPNRPGVLQTKWVCGLEVTS